MPLPLFFPTVRYVPAIDRSQAITLEQLCERAAGRCEAFGRWVQRPVVLLRAHEQAPWLKAEPGDWGAVEIGVPNRGSAQREAQWALGALAFVLFDGVARATVQGKAWARIEQPRGPAPKPRRAASNSERQRRFRSKQRSVAS